MLKGCQKEMIVMETRDSAFFEHAYFVLRRESTAAAEADMLAEADRIIGAGSGYLKRRRRSGRAGWILVGFLAGLTLFAFIHLLIGF